MFGVDSGELFIVILVAVMVIGPKDLPRVLRSVGHWVGKARGMANQFRSGVDDLMRESEIVELEKKWREQNEAIMRAHPAMPPESDWGLPTPPQPASAEVIAAVSLDKGGSGQTPPSASEPAPWQIATLAAPAPAPGPGTPSAPGNVPLPIKAVRAAPRESATEGGAA